MATAMVLVQKHDLMATIVVLNYNHDRRPRSGGALESCLCWRWARPMCRLKGSFFFFLHVDDVFGQILEFPTFSIVHISKYFRVRIT